MTTLEFMAIQDFKTRIENRMAVLEKRWTDHETTTDTMFQLFHGVIASAFADKLKEVVNDTSRTDMPVKHRQGEMEKRDVLLMPEEDGNVYCTQGNGKSKNGRG